VYANIGMFVKFLSRQTLLLVQKAGVRRNGGLQESPSAGVDPKPPYDMLHAGHLRQWERPFKLCWRALLVAFSAESCSTKADSFRPTYTQIQCFQRGAPNPSF